MKYMGSKNRHAKHILPIILGGRRDGQFYVEPFVGGFNTMDKVDGPRIAGDSHYYLIELFRAIRSGWIPPDFITEEQYEDIRTNSGKYEPQLVGFVGFGCSYSGKWFGGYARGNDNRGNPRNYADESRRNLLAQAPKLKDVIILRSHYFDLPIPKNSIVYCDPPYENTTKYKHGFDHKEFWCWVRNLVSKNHTVFVSEYNAPPDFECVWSKEVNNTLVKDTGSKKGVERLFRHCSQM